MKKIIKLITLTAIVVSLLSCATTKTETKNVAYAGMYDQKPVSVLIMPPINKTTSIEAKEYFYSTLKSPVAEKGYYVIPPFISMEILKRESAYDAERFLEAPLKKFGELYGADVALFTIIHSWDKNALTADVTVGVEYIVRSIKTGETLYHRKGTIVYDTSIKVNAGGIFGLLASVAASAVSTAVTDYVPVARACNSYTLEDLPAGKYNPKFDKDGEEPAGVNNFTATIDK